MLGRTIIHLQAKCQAQVYLLKKGLKKFELKGENAVKEELIQMHDRTYFRSLVVPEMNHLEEK